MAYDRKNCPLISKFIHEIGAANVQNIFQFILYELVFKGPVSRLEKDHNWTGPRPEKTGPAVQPFHF